ncbi:phosphatase PAP2 family protein [Belnapia sp. F-4-1]|uniref:phosphatase PAP2 family protein n=1 Tax=Belnapia sp. F-4-1 TaxID=1545443 RepID=UPI00068B86DC|nr:phosphatase PAP2 family protein [Belnapia sp. F-4-1]
MMERFDLWVTKSVNAYAGQSVVLDQFIGQICFYNSVKMLPIVAAFFALWLGAQKTGQGRRLFLQGIFGGFAALVASRLIQNLGPNRPRPLYAISDFVVPIDRPADVLRDWGSFPSDTAALSFALSFALWRADRRLGAAAFAWSAVIVCFPRLYCGLHYMSDLLAGAMIGIVATILVGRWHRLTDFAIRVTERAERRHATIFGIALVMLAYQFTTMFEDVRVLARRAQSMVTMVIEEEARPPRAAIGSENVLADQSHPGRP